MFKTVALCFGMLGCALAVGGVPDTPVAARFDQSLAVFGGEARLTCALHVTPAAAQSREPGNEPVVASADSVGAPAP